MISWPDETVVNEAKMLLEYDISYEQVGIKMGIPYSTVGHHMKYRLQEIDVQLWNEVQAKVIKHKPNRWS